MLFHKLWTLKFTFGQELYDTGNINNVKVSDIVRQNTSSNLMPAFEVEIHVHLLLL